MLPQDVEKLIKFAEKSSARAIGVLPDVYWKDLNHIFSPKTTFQPIMAIRPEVRFWDCRNVNCSYEVCDADMHHLAWCDLRDMKRKSVSWGHANLYSKEQGEQWYQYYLNWKEGDKAMDLFGNVSDLAIKPLPKELRDKLGVV